jgi:hypothetical protein
MPQRRRDRRFALRFDCFDRAARRARSRSFVLLVALASCGAEREGTRAVDANDRQSDPVPISGIYDVKGVTTPVAGEDYQPTRTRLTGQRVADHASSLPNQAAPARGN